MSIASLTGAPTPYEVTGKIDELITQVNQNDTDIDAKISTSQKGAANGVATLNSNSKVTATQASADVISVPSSRNLLHSDNNRLLRVYTSSSLTITITSEGSAGSYPTDMEVEFMLSGTGSLKISPSSGVTLYSKDNARTVANQYSGASLKKIGTNAWWLVGDLE